MFEAAGINAVWHEHTTVAPHVHQFVFQDEHVLYADAARRALERIWIPTTRTIVTDAQWHPIVTGY
ncbi:hypothetical protein COT79_03405 [Candidatus Berkelbacteria bacterium CG10_big_fil_rev_8_21_14_0_10_43_14]|uniref:Uncharacterized protein n=1 Tax=Candidatus Berkelbacteria bacterium CG10_big_fil_rev_8_21_14_0_10_43_14 TaxID=1974515 RepID=A0A2M6R7Z5_9BACT|nr:MAG: hypothetical protein COT79_03405 [Candidatus Berkelbacteria bacterium CG10_big_fil_rev_8_21_14_0_10_43_14]